MADVTIPAVVGAPYDDLLKAGAGAAPFWLTGEDNIQFNVRNAAAGVTVTMFGRFLDVCGTISPFVYDLPVPSTRALTSLLVRLGEGWVIAVSVRVTAGTPRIGQTYAQVRLQRGDSGTSIPISTIVQGYVTAVDDLAWPNSAIVPSASGFGVLRGLVAANPGAGNEFTITQDTSTRWRPLGLSVLFTASAVAANREVSLSISVGGGPNLLLPTGVTHTANQARTYTFTSIGVRGAGAQSLNVISPMPPVLTNGGAVYASSTTALDAGDVYSSIRMLVEEWIEV
jgi:hypothetical protein